VDQPVTDRIDAAIAAAEPIVRGIRADQWHDATPCEHWDVARLVNHLVGGMRIFAAQIAGDAVPGDHDDDWLGDDPIAAWAFAAAADRAAWRRQDALDGTITISLGALPAEIGAWVHLTELVVHAVDVAVATGQEGAIDEDLVRDLLAAMRALGFEAFRTPDSFDPEQPVAEDAPAHLRLLAYLGRTVSVAAAP
jgi:uncharacterized protein (TIGR03086 family)